MKIKVRLIKIGLACIGITLMGSARSQTFAEWFEQKKTQLKYDAQQIAALAAYAKDLEKGYQIVQDGLKVIHDIKQGDFDLHHGYFNSLLSVNSSVKNNDAVGGSRHLQQLILQQMTQTTNQVKTSGQFNAAEIRYIGIVWTNLIATCSADMTELAALTTDGNYSLQDKQRLDRIQAIYENILDKYNFSQHFGAQVSLIIAQRNQIGLDRQSVQRIYDLKQLP